MAKHTGTYIVAGEGRKLSINDLITRPQLIVLIDKGDKSEFYLGFSNIFFASVNV